MTVVYVVTAVWVSYENPGDVLIGVFSDKSLARKCATEQAKCYWHKEWNIHIDAVVVDKTSDVETNPQEQSCAIVENYNIKDI
jgi:hypothetical protein